MTGEVIRASRATAHRDERDRDRAQPPLQDQQDPTRYDYVHSLVDDHTRLAYSEILPDEKGPTCAAFMTRAADYAATHGITRIERVMTDNAFAYRFSLHQVCAALGASQIFTRPHCPWQNGKVQRLNRTLQVEWAYREVFTSNDQRAAAPAPWLEHYNTQRRHSALGGLPPISRLPT
jgi:transposase InsO family protein